MAAKRDWSAAAVEDPIMPSPANNMITLPAASPRTQTRAPPAEINAAVLNEMRRPRRSANWASGTANAAAPERRHRRREARPSLAGQIARGQCADRQRRAQSEATQDLADGEHDERAMP